MRIFIFIGEKNLLTIMFAKEVCYQAMPYLLFCRSFDNHVEGEFVFYKEGMTEVIL